MIGLAEPLGHRLAPPPVTRLAGIGVRFMLKAEGPETRVVAFITEADPVRRILTHIGEPAEPPRISPARGPPAWEDPAIAAVPDWDALAQAQPEYLFDRQIQW